MSRFKKPRRSSTSSTTLMSPPAAASVATGSSGKARSKYTSPGDAFWEQAFEECDAVIPEPRQGKENSSNHNLAGNGDRTEAMGPGIAELRNASRGAGVTGASTVKSSSVAANYESSNRPERLVPSPVPVRHFDFEDCVTLKAEADPTAEPAAVADHADLAADSPAAVKLEILENSLAYQEKHQNEGYHDSARHQQDGMLLHEPQLERALDKEAQSTRPAQTKEHEAPSEKKALKGVSEEAACRQSTLGCSSVDGEQRQGVDAETSLLTSEERERARDLSMWLPEAACSVYARKGVTRMYDWQVECLHTSQVLNGQNLVYSASTSAGKSLVAELLLIRRILTTGKKAILVLPFVSVCTEKAEHMEAVLEPLGKRVRNFFGSQGGATLQPDTALAVCTIEKANSLVNKLLEEGRLGEVGIVVIDEIHMVGDADRGYLLELLLTKLRYAAGLGIPSPGKRGQTATSTEAGRSKNHSGRGRKAEDLLSPLRSPTRFPGSSGKLEGDGLQIVGMSATMPNVAAVAKWLNAVLYSTEFRPVPLDEYIKVGPNIMHTNMEPVRSLPVGADRGGKDPDHIVELCDEITRDGHSVLVFCPSRKSCETVACHIAQHLPAFVLDRPDRMAASPEDDLVDADAVMEALRKCPGGLDSVLGECVPHGVAYHHAGLTVEEREILERAYRRGIVRVLTATSTLAAGVNLPARRVIFRQPRVGRDLIDATKYRQMAGRAGRAGIDSKGESILICKPDEARKLSEIILSGCTPLESCLLEEHNGMGRALLEVVASGIVQTAADVKRYVRCTLLNVMRPFEQVVRSAQEALRWLCQQRLVEWCNTTSMYSCTPLGQAAFSSALSPEECLLVFDDLVRARNEGLVLASDLHLVYQVTPVTVSTEPDWGVYYRRYLELSEVERTIGAKIGVTEPFLMRMAHTGPPIHLSRPTTRAASRRNMIQKSSSIAQSTRGVKQEGGGGSSPDISVNLRVSKRFYVALMLSQLVQEVPINAVCDTFGVPRGSVQGLQETAGRFAAMVAAFCERLGWLDLQALIAKFQQRVSFGVRAEIVELTEIPFVKAARARALYKAGLRNPQAVAEASSHEIAKALASFSWGSGGGGRGAATQMRMQLMVAGRIRKGARKIVLEKAEESRVAAFTALRALGVEIPKALEEATITVPTSDSLPHSPPYALPPIPEDAPQALPSTAGETRPTTLENGQGEQQGSVAKHRRAPETKLETGSKGGAPEQGPRAPEESRAPALAAPSSIIPGHGGAPAMRPCENTKGREATGMEPPSKRIKVDASAQEPTRPCLMGTSTNPASARAGLVSWRGAKEFAGEALLALPETPPKGSVINKTPLAPQGPDEKGPIDVDALPGGFDSFMQEWAEQNEYVVDLHAEDGHLQGEHWAWEVEGMAVCWGQSRVFYVNLCSPPAGKAEEAKLGDLQKDWAEWVEARWSRLLQRLCTGHGTGIVWDLKLCLKMLSRPYVASPYAPKGQGRSACSTALPALPVLSRLAAVKGHMIGGQMQLHLGGPGADKSAAAAGATAEGALGDAERDSSSVQLCPIPGAWRAADVRLLAWILAPDEESSQQWSLEQVVSRKLPSKLASAAQRAGRWSAHMGRAARNGCCRRAAQVLALHGMLWKMLFSERLEEPLMGLETALVPVLADMELQGVAVNVSECRRLRGLLLRRLKQLEANAHEMAGIEFSLTNPGEVAVVLYKRLKLPMPPGCKPNKLQHTRTDKQALDWLKQQHPIAEVIKEHRTLSKLLLSTIDSLMRYAQLYRTSGAQEEAERDGGVGGCEHEDESLGPLVGESEDSELLRLGEALERQGQRRHKIFGTWLQTSTSTGRLSIEDPNLQCVEHAVTFTLEPTEKEKQQEPGRGPMAVELNPRALFVPSKPDRVMIAADYSQIEVRLMAHFSQDTALIAHLSDNSADLFKRLAAAWSGMPESEISSLQRDRTKRLVYGILYGMGVSALADRLGCSSEEALGFRQRFLAAFPGVARWLETAVETCRKRGHITTLLGRRRYLDKINTCNRTEQAKAARQAVNSICQGSAADLIKLAMLRLHSVLTATPIAPLLSPQAPSLDLAAASSANEAAAAATAFLNSLPSASDSVPISGAKGTSTESLALGGARNADDEGVANRFTHLAGRCQLLLQIHDELLIEADSAVAEQAAELLKWSMESIVALRGFQSWTHRRGGPFEDDKWLNVPERAVLVLISVTHTAHNANHIMAGLTGISLASQHMYLQGPRRPILSSKEDRS